MSSFLTASKLSRVVNHGLRFHQTRAAAKVASLGFHTSPTSSFRSATQQQGQAGLARAPEREYAPEPIMRDLPESIIQSTVTPQAPAQSVEDVLKSNGAAEGQKAPKQLVEKAQTRSESLVDPATIPAYHRGSKFERVPYWQKIRRWKSITENQFLSYRWGVS